MKQKVIEAHTKVRLVSFPVSVFWVCLKRKIYGMQQINCSNSEIYDIQCINSKIHNAQYPLGAISTGGGAISTH